MHSHINSHYLWNRQALWKIPEQVQNSKHFPYWCTRFLSVHNIKRSLYKRFNYWRSKPFGLWKLTSQNERWLWKTIESCFLSLCTMFRWYEPYWEAKLRQGISAVFNQQRLVGFFCFVLFFEAGKIIAAWDILCVSSG